MGVGVSRAGGVIAVVGGRGGERVGLACRGGAGCGVARRLVSLIFEPRVGGASGPWFVAASAVCNRASPSVGNGRGAHRRKRGRSCVRDARTAAPASTRQTVVMSVPGLGGGGDLP